MFVYYELDELYELDNCLIKFAVSLSNDGKTTPMAPLQGTWLEPERRHVPAPVANHVGNDTFPKLWATITQCYSYQFQPSAQKGKAERGDFVFHCTADRYNREKCLILYAITFKLYVTGEQGLVVSVQYGYIKCLILTWTLCFGATDHDHVRRLQPMAMVVAEKRHF